MDQSAKSNPAENAISIAAYIAISSTMLIVNKASVHVLPYPFFVTNLQMIASVVVIYGMKLGGIVSFPNPNIAKVRSWVGVTIAWVLPILANMKALQLLSVETVLVFRTMTVLGVAFGDRIFLGTIIDRISFLGLCTITLGGLTYGFYDVSYDSQGYFWAFLYWASMVGNALYIKTVFNNAQQMSTWEKSFLNNAMTVPLLTLHCIFNENMTQAMVDMQDLSLQGLGLVLLSCFMGLGISVAGTRCREVFSATAFDVLGNMNKFLSIALSQYLLGSIVSGQSLCGLVLALFGGILYSPLGKKLVGNFVSQKETKEEAAALEAMKDAIVDVAEMLGDDVDDKII
jgi:GDP-mannose transporter